MRSMVMASKYCSTADRAVLVTHGAVHPVIRRDTATAANKIAFFMSLPYFFVLVSYKECNNIIA